MSDTPRTDACLSSEFANLKALNLLIAESRKLERELAEALERVKRLEEAGARMFPHFAQRATPHKKAVADEWEKAIRK